MFNTLLKKLIKAAGGRIKMVMAIIGLSVATLLILFSVQLQANYYDLLNAKTNQDSITNFLVINKVLNNETIGKSSITADNIADFKKQNFVQEVETLTPSAFKASLESNNHLLPFRTDMIPFESVDKSFIDIKVEDFNWNEQQDYVPIVVPITYLDIYNLEIALAQGLPQITEDIVKMVKFDVTVPTPRGNKIFQGKIVGFSNRFTSLLVPQEFMNWGNQFAANKATPSRLIIKTKDPGSPALVSFLEKNGYTTDADKTRFSKYRKIVNTVVSISWGTGAIMLAFALLIFTLFIQLTVTACKSEIALLITLGTAPRQLEKFLMKQFFPANILIVSLCLFTITVLQFFTAKWLTKLNMFVSNYTSTYTIAVSVLLLLVLWIVNKFTVRKYVYSNAN